MDVAKVDTETRDIKVADRFMVVSILTLTKSSIQYLDKLQGAMDNGYMELAEQFLASPHATNQKTACLITDITQIRPLLTTEMLNQWYSQAQKDDVPTQHALFRLFKRPVVQVNVSPNFVMPSSHSTTPQPAENVPSKEFNKMIQNYEETVNPEANQVFYTETFDEAITQAISLLKIAHRLTD